MARSVEVVGATSVLLVELDEALRYVGGENPRLDLFLRPVVRLEAELHEIALLGRELAAADGKPDGRGVPAHLGREVELHDVAVFDRLVARARDRVARRLLGEAVHREPLVLRAVLVDALLRDAHELEFRLAGSELRHHRLRREIGDARRLADAGDLVRALDAAESEHDVVRPDDLRLRERLPEAVELHDVGVELRRDADSDVLSRDAELREYVPVGLGLQLGIRRIRALPVLVDDADALHPAEVAREDLAFGADHECGLSVRGDSDAAALEQGPEVREVPRVGVVRLRAVYDEDVKPPLRHKLRGLGYARLEFFFRYRYARHIANLLLDV